MWTSAFASSVQILTEDGLTVSSAGTSPKTFLSALTTFAGSSEGEMVASSITFALNSGGDIILPTFNHLHNLGFQFGRCRVLVGDGLVR